MIIKATRISTGSGAGAVAAHVLRGQKNEEIRLLQGSEAEMHAAMRDAEAAGAKYGLRHYKISPKEGMTSDDAREVLRDLAQEFGFEAERATLTEHRLARAGGQGFDRHWHALVPEVDPVTGRVLDSSWMRPRHEKMARMAEERLGHALVPGRWNAAVQRQLEAEGQDGLAARMAPLAEMPRPASAYTTDAHQRAARRGHDLPADRLTVREAWERSDNAQAFSAALAEQGITIRPGDKPGIWIAERDGDLLGAVHRLTGERKADVAARMDAAPAPAPEAPTPAPTEPPQPPMLEPTPTPPAGGPPPSPDKGTPAGAQAPASPGAGIPASPGARPAASGGGGASASTAQDSPRPAAALGDAGPGPGEPPGPGASPDELARYRAKLAAYQARKDAAWAAWVKSQAAQEKKGGNAPAPGGGGQENGLVQQQEAGRTGAHFASSIIAAAQRAHGRAEVAAALADVARPGVHGDQDLARRGDALAAGGRELGSSGVDADRDSDPRRQRIPGQDSGNPGQSSSDPGEPGRPETAERRNPLAAAADGARLNAALAIADPSRMRTAMAALKGLDDPTAGMSPQEKRTAVQQWRADLVALYRQDGAVLREQGRADWRDRLAAERVRTQPAAEALRRNWRHLTKDERAAGWQQIKDAREALIQQMKQEAESRPKRDFTRWLEFVAIEDPKAAAVLSDLQERHARAQQIKHALDGEEARIQGIRATAPQGERNPDAAAQIEKDKLRAEHARAVEAAARAAAEAQEAKARIGFVDRVGHAFGFQSEAMRQAEDLERAASRASAAADARIPSPADFRAATVEGRETAERNQKAFDGWQARTGQQADRRDALLTGIREALADGDPKMKSAVLHGGIDAAMKLQAARDAEDERRRQEAERTAMRNVIPMRGNTGGMAAPAPRMR